MSERFRQQFDDEPQQAITSLADSTFGKPATAPRRNAIVPQPDGSMMYKGIKITAVGLMLPDDLDGETLFGFAKVASGLQTSMQWVIGDLMNSIDRVRGEYDQYAALFNVERKTLVDWAYVCRSVDMSIRIDALTFGHHQLVAADKYDRNQKYEWLAWAAQEGASIADMRKAMKGDTTPTPPTLIERLTNDFVSYSKGLESMGQGERAQLKQLAKALISQIDKLEGR